AVAVVRARDRDETQDVFVVVDHEQPPPVRHVLLAPPSEAVPLPRLPACPYGRLSGIGEETASRVGSRPRLASGRSHVPTARHRHTLGLDGRIFDSFPLHPPIPLALSQRASPPSSFEHAGLV